MKRSCVYNNIVTMVMEISAKTVVLVFYNYMAYLLNDQGYQASLKETTGQFFQALYGDLTSLIRVNELPEQSFMSISEMAIQSGYACEEYKILTDDGYILTSYRLPGKLSTNSTLNSYAIDKNGNPKQPVQLQHGVFDQGGTWFFNEPQKSLAFRLVDEGYDVWITNSRGTSHSF